MSKQRKRFSIFVLPAVLIMTMLALMSGFSSAQTRELATSVVQVAKLTASDGDIDDHFGVRVSIGGDTIVIGVSDDDDHGSDSGSAYIFERDHGGSGSWGEAAKLTAPDGAFQDYFGSSVCIDGDTVVVGAREDDDDGDGSGSAYIFERDEGGPGHWGQVAKLTAADGTALAYFGAAVSISSDTVVVGAYRDDDNGNQSGSAYLFERDEGGPGNWGEVAKLIATDGAEQDWFGNSVSINGDTVVVGAYGDDDNGNQSGSAYIFERDEGGPGNWGQVAKLTAPDAVEMQCFGVAVSISGDTAVVGAMGDDDNGLGSGAAYIFERDEGGSDNWGQVAKLVASDGAEYDSFGWTVSNSGDSVVAGAPSHDDNFELAGSAYVFQRDEGGPGNWGQMAKLTATDAAYRESFGNAVSNSGKTVVVGVPGDDDPGDGFGSAYVFFQFEPVAWIYLPVVLRNAP